MPQTLAGEMVPQVKALAEDLGSVPSTHIALPAICKSSPRGSDALFRALAAHRQNTHTHVLKWLRKREEGQLPREGWQRRKDQRSLFREQPPGLSSQHPLRNKRKAWLFITFEGCRDVSCHMVNLVQHSVFDFEKSMEKPGTINWELSHHSSHWVLLSGPDRVTKRNGLISPGYGIQPVNADLCPKRGESTPHSQKKMFHSQKDGEGGGGRLRSNTEAMDAKVSPLHGI